MKKVSFDTSASVALHVKLGQEFTPEQSKPVKREGWLIGDHVCVQKPRGDDEGWCLSLYPWGDRLTTEFFAKADAVACAKEIAALDLPWKHLRSLDPRSSEYGHYIVWVRLILASYEVEGFMTPMDNL